MFPRRLSETTGIFSDEKWLPLTKSGMYPTCLLYQSYDPWLVHRKIVCFAIINN